jgi:hypothetical protein
MVALQRALLGAATVGRWRSAVDARSEGSLKLSEVLDLSEVLAALAPLRPALQAMLGARLCIDADECWVRRARPAHLWHQDGALRHDFLAAPGLPPADALLAMRTLWITLTPCGVDAPGLEWAEPSPQHLLVPAELTEAAVDAAWPGRVHPALDAGDALLFDGALLHRTHRTPAMARPRTSIELRFFAAPAPARLAGDRMLAWH